ncbi:hypothetical protein HMPREF1544_11212 [Mucor circinelloides 1006PhL]|uniref:Uncharacterized protein n=1 Tax=Mucor circinelloides f. circinelloides (strain 1006PhL) TaxID=1220926 RepID=S2J1N0_MUCC1|nr:hypothetical protein HMPREF1544_11212 [Mucor circinelloides 1006PhL]
MPGLRTVRILGSKPKATYNHDSAQDKHKKWPGSILKNNIVIEESYKDEQQANYSRQIKDGLDLNQDATFSDTENRLVTMTETVPFGIKRYKLHLDLFHNQDLDKRGERILFLKTVPIHCPSHSSRPQCILRQYGRSVFFRDKLSALAIGLIGLSSIIFQRTFPQLTNRTGYTNTEFISKIEAFYKGRDSRASASTISSGSIHIQIMVTDKNLLTFSSTTTSCFSNSIVTSFTA